MAIQSYRDLTVWQKGMDMVFAVYELTDHFPTREQFRLTSQMHRAAVSVPSNIAEGHGRLSKAEYIHFLSISRGSLSELETQMEIALRLGYVNEEQIADTQSLSQEVGRLLNGLIRSLNSTDKGPGRIREITEPYEPDWPLAPDP